MSEQFRNPSIWLEPTEEQDASFREHRESSRYTYIDCLNQREDYDRKTRHMDKDQLDRYLARLEEEGDRKKQPFKDRSYTKKSRLKRFTYQDQARQLAACRRDPELPHMKKVASDIQRGILLRLDRACEKARSEYPKKMKKWLSKPKHKRGKKPRRFPYYPAKDRWDSFDCVTPKLDIENKLFIMPKFGPVKWVHRGGLPKYVEHSTVTQATIGLNSEGVWVATVGVKFEQEDREDDGTKAGVDAGARINNMIKAAVFDPRNHKNKEFKGVADRVLTFNRPDASKFEKRIAKLSRKLSKQVKGSARYERTKNMIARRHADWVRMLKYHQHKATAELTRDYYQVATEDIDWSNVTRSAKGTVENPGKNVKAKSGLNRVTLKASPGRVRQMIEYKAGRHVKVDPRYTSQICNSCGHSSPDNRHEQQFLCKACGHRDDADENAARNVLARAEKHPSLRVEDKVVGLPENRESNLNRGGL